MFRTGSLTGCRLGNIFFVQAASGCVGGARSGYGLDVKSACAFNFQAANIAELYLFSSLSRIEGPCEGELMAVAAPAYRHSPCGRTGYCFRPRFYGERRGVFIVSYLVHSNWYYALAGIILDPE